MMFYDAFYGREERAGDIAAFARAAPNSELPVESVAASASRAPVLNL